MARRRVGSLLCWRVDGQRIMVDEPNTVDATLTGRVPRSYSRLISATLVGGFTYRQVTFHSRRAIR